MNPGANVERIAELIQLAVAPVFLLSAIATTLMVLLGRLARIVDRGRSLEERGDNDGLHRRELLSLERRAHLIYRALALGVLAAISVTVLMTLAFMGEVMRFDAARMVAVLFVAALFTYTGTLLCLLREVFLAVANFRLGIHAVHPASGKKR